MPSARRWHWWTCPRCFNSKAGKEPGEGRITAELVQTMRPHYPASASHPAYTLTLETWRLTCPRCGHVWERTRETSRDG